MRTRLRNPRTAHTAIRYQQGSKGSYIIKIKPDMTLNFDDLNYGILVFKVISQKKINAEQL
ncbi:MAG: hypothetical protein ACOC2U_01965 [bacterium]